MAICRGAGADNGNLLLNIGLLNLARGNSFFKAKEGVDGAGNNSALEAAAAVLAAQTGTVVVFLAFAILTGHQGVGKQGTAH
jgi:hypothetical protein